MKKLFLLSLAAVLLLTACKKDDDNGPAAITVNQNRQIMFFEFCAAWCAPCGSWGNDAFNSAIASNFLDVVPVSIHGSTTQKDGMTIAENDVLKTNFPITGWPNFRIGNIGKGTSTNINSDVASIKATPIIAQVGYVVTEELTTYNIEANVKFFNNANGAYYVSFYAIEDLIPGHDGVGPGPNGGRMDQAGDNSSTYVHNQVLRGVSTDGVFGQIVSLGAVEIESEFPVSAVIQKQAHWNLNNVKIIAFIWERKATSPGELEYEYVNANSNPVQ